MYLCMYKVSPLGGNDAHLLPTNILWVDIVGIFFLSGMAIPKHFKRILPPSCLPPCLACLPDMLPCLAVFLACPSLGVGGNRHRQGHLIDALQHMAQYDGDHLVTVTCLQTCLGGDGLW